MANNPCNIIRYDSEIGRLYDPTILLKTRSGKTLGNIIYDKESWSIKLSATDLDEISFDVYKYVDDKKNPVWDDLIDLRLIDVKGYGQFEISVDYSDKEQTIKTITAKSLETELGQLYLDEFHVNDDDATTMIMTDYNKDDFDADGNFIPTVFYNKDDSKHSLLDRVLADKAPHWSIGHVPEYIAVDKENEPELSSKFQRIFTVDGTTIYDFLTGDVAKECNVIFTFDTYNRIINCYNLEDYTWVSEDGKRTITINAIGNDTGIFIDKRKLAKEITITSKSDEVKNALKVKAGDDVISDYVRAANLNGSNMIYNFAKFQLDDMPKGLVNYLEKYQEMMDADANDYYGKNGIFTRLAKLYDDLLYYQSDMMPDVHLNETTAKEQYDSVKTYLQSNPVAVYDIETYSSTSFQGITNNVDAMANVGIDSRYKFEIIKDSVSYDSNTHKWKGRYTITRRTDDTDTYSSPDNEFTIVTINDDNLSYTKQKIEKALSKTDMSTVDFDVSNYTTDKQLYDYFNLYSQNRLKGFVEGYDSCISILASAVSTAKVTTNIVELQKKYKQRYDQCNKVYEERKKQVEDIQSRIVTLQDEQSKFASEHNLKNWLDKTDSDYYRIFCMYIREDTYENSNYISDGLTDSECINKAKELLNTAQAELKKSCVLQRTISTSINNLLCMSEFEKLREDFCLFNYIRVGTDDEVFKLRLIDVSFNASDPSGIDVTYSENIESVDGKTSDIKSILDQASSIASTYTYTSLQAKSGATANFVVTDMRNNGINAALMRLSNSDDNEVTYGREGIICKQVTDDGFYSDKATRITGSGMYITNDNWNTIKACIGETTDGNYGVIADTIVGKLIAGDQLVISNGNGSVKITGDGINITNGSITWSADGSDGVKSPSIQQINGLNEYLTQLDGRIQTFSQITDPSIDWTTTALKEQHTGDIWVNPNNGLTKQWTGTKWVEITDSELKKLAESKAQIFTSEPKPPYYVGDLWVQGSNGDILHCKTKRTSGNYNASDWEKSSKYTDDTAWKNWTSDTGDFGKYKKDIQTQIDGKSNCTYGGSTPPSNPETGDLWFCTNGSNGYGKDKAYMYDGATWKESNGVPDSVWDKVDGKSSIYVEEPTNGYKKNDLWILAENTIFNGRMYDKGSVVTAIRDYTDRYNPNDWSILVKYTDDTKAKEVDKKLSTFKSDVEGCLGTIITSDAVISPKIGGGYLCISKKNGCKVIINPEGEEITPSIIAGSDLSKYVFRVDDPKETVLFGVTTDGDVNICNGGMTYSNGACKIANFTISQNNMHTDNATFDNTEGIYFGSSGLRIGESFKIYSDGTTIAKGRITITDGLYAINPISNTPVKMLSLSNMGNVGTVYTDYSIYTKSDITGSKAIFSDGIKADYINPNNLTGSVNINGVNISRTGIDGYSKSDHVHGALYAGNDWISFDVTNGRWAMYVNGGSYATFDGESFAAPQFKGKISNGTYYVTLNSNNNFIPSVNQVINCGTSEHSWKNMYSNGAKVTTSDARYKKIICNISDDERYEVLFNNLKPKLYKYKNFKETDNHDRIHSGYISQEVKDAMSIAGIDNTEFAAFCYSNFENDQDAIDNNNGFKDKYMLGYEEFIALNTAMIQKLSKKIEKQQEEINELKEKIK